MGGSSGSTTTKTEPWGGQQPYLSNIFENAMNLYGDPSKWPQYYPGSTVAPFNPMELAGIQGVANTAFGPASQLAASQANTHNFLLGDVLRPESNPALQAHAYYATLPTAQHLAWTALPNVRSGASQAGQYGGSRQGIAEANAINAATQQMYGQTADIYNRAYGQGLEAMTQALQMTPQVMGMMYNPSIMLGNAGSTMRQMDQAMIDQYYDRWNYNQWLPWDMLGLAQNMVSGNYGGTSTSRANQGASPLQIVGTLGSLAAVAMGQGWAAPIIGGATGAASGGKK